LAPSPGTPERATFLQWLHFAESTAFPPLGIVVWLSRYRDDAADNAQLIADSRLRAAAVLGYVEQALDGDYLVGDEFTAADVMMGFTLQAAALLGVLTDDFPKLQGYLARITDRDAFRRAVEKTGN
jgi:glutathione S-transferase